MTSPAPAPYAGPTPFPSDAPQAQDVVLLRALGVGAEDAPIRCAEQLETQPGEGPGSAPLLTALGDAGWQEPAEGEPLHVLSVHGTQFAAALEGAPTRPWILLVTDADREQAADVDGYQHVLFDGMSDYLLCEDIPGLSVAEHTRLADALSTPACVRDAYTTTAQREAAADLARWRTRALDAWASRSIEAASSAAQQELADLRASTSWKITKPIRVVGDKIPQRFRG